MSVENNILPELPNFDMDYQKLTDQNGVGVIPANIVDSQSGEFLMTGFMNQEAFTMSRQLREVVFWSRTRKELWYKGATSGNKLPIQTWKQDCDRDTLLILVNPLGSVCHRPGKNSCFDE